MGKKVSEVMTKRIVSVAKEATLSEAATLMKEKSIRHLLIVESSSNQFLGMISDRDIKKFLSPFIGSSRATPQDVATSNIEVGKVMVPKDKIISAKADDDVKTVVDKMLQKKFGAMPILDDQGKASGIITRGDLLKVLMTLL